MEVIKDYGGVFALATLVVTVTSLIYAWYRMGALPDWKEKLADPEECQKIISQGAHPWADAYFLALKKLRIWSASFYGARKMGFQAFERCFGLAFCYPFVAMSAAWALTNEHSSGDIPLFEDVSNFWWRMCLILLLFLTIISLTYLICHIEQIAGKIEGFIKRSTLFSAIGNERQSQALAFISVFVALLVTIGGAVLLTVAIASISFGVLAGVTVCVVAITFACERTGIRVFFIVLCMMAFVIFCLAVDYSGVSSRSMKDLAAMFAFLFLLLPLANAFADYLSIAATRSFLEWAEHHRPGLSHILGVVFLDLFFGAICLGGLLLVLPLSLELWATISPRTIPLNWHDYLQNARNDWTRGIALGLMALTTILPTLLHLVLGLGAMLTYGLRLRRRAVRHLEECLLNGGPSDVNRTKIAKRLLRADICGVMLSLLMVCFLFAASMLLIWNTMASSDLPVL